MKIFALGEIPEELYPFIGGKAMGLDKLKKAGYPVPRGFLITETERLDKYQILAYFEDNGYKQVSVRSSASNEDGVESSHAGQYETYLFVNEDTLLKRIDDCIASLNSLRASSYDSHFDIKKGESMNIVVQEMVDSKYAGVIFTSSPRNGSCVLMEVVEGQGENLVSGSSSAFQYEISRKNFLYKKGGPLKEEEVRAIYGYALKIRKEFGDMDLEFAINGGFYLLQMRPITTETIDLEEFDRDEDLSGHLFTKRNVGEMMPGAVTPLTLSTSTKAIDYGMRYMLMKAGHYKRVDQVAPLKMISSFSGHLFFDMDLLYAMHTRVGIANPQSMNLSIMGEYHDYPPIKEKNANFLIRGINSLRFLHYVFSGNKANKRFDALFPKVRFENTLDHKKLYDSITFNLRYLDESLVYHYASSSNSGSASSTLYMMLDKLFPDKKEYQAFYASLLINIPNIESADILYRLTEIAREVKEKSGKVDFTNEELLSFIRNDERLRAKYEGFLGKHGHRTIKEAEMRNKPWREDQESLMQYIRSILLSTMELSQKGGEVDLKEKFAFVKNPLLRKMAKVYAKKCRQAVVDREYTKSRLIKMIDLFKTQYRKLALLLVEAKLLSDEDQIYFLTHEEIGKLIEGESNLEHKASLRREALKLQEELSFDDTYIGRPIPISSDYEEGDGSLKGVPISIGESEGIVRIVRSVEDANKLKEGEIMVAKFTDIGWTPYYSTVKGLITEIGSSLSHGAVVAREYGLPTIVNVAGATKRLQDGDRIKMDATRGIISRL
ncbi:MAG: hypothetical protein K6B65_05290 [Bacilli bacterium]|nr:hypothetical protein [Bacilli bacterium]